MTGGVARPPEECERGSFSRQPEYLTLRLNYTGMFPAGERRTTALRPDARIMSIAVSSYVP